jgi:PAS domain S-box-containing protein
MSATGDARLRAILLGTGEMAGRLRALDWRRTDVGAPDTWPETLRVVVGLCLASRSPSFVCWGPNRTLLYNDACIALFGEANHPRCLGRPARECCNRLNAVIAPLLDRVHATGEPAASDDAPFCFTRDFPREELRLTFTFTPLLAADGSVVGVYCPCVEPTEVARFVAAERALRASEARVNTILESITDQFFAFDRHGRLTYMNRHAVEQMRRLGKDPDALIGSSLWEELPYVLDEAAVRRVLEERVPVTDELFYAPLGEWLENHMYPSHDGGLVTFQRYVTRRKRTEDELRKTQAELARVARINNMGELAASIAHEINQPLGAIVNNARASVLQLYEDPEKSREALLDIAADARRASAIIARIRALLRRTPTERVPLRPADLVREVLAVAHRELCDRSVVVRTDVAPDLPRVFGDRVQLQQVVLNLVVNAAEAMVTVDPARRLLTITGAMAAIDRAPAVRLEVRDLGIGFERGGHEKAFEAFYTTKPGGLGMGLRISRSIVEAHGGWLRATPNDGPGATFEVVLPVED